MAYYKPKPCRDNEPTMIIYLIRNEINGKGYVGQSQKCFRFRYSGGGSKRWWRYVDNLHLKHAIAKDGYANFSVTILESNISSNEMLDARESHYIRELETMNPKGYNVVAGGQQIRRGWMSIEERDRQALNRRGGKVARLLNNETGVTVDVVNVNRFCKDNDLLGPSVTRVIQGTQAHHGVWSLPDKPMRKFDIVSVQTGERVTLLDEKMATFCRERGIKYQGNLSCMLHSKAKTSYGWKLYVAD